CIYAVSRYYQWLSPGEKFPMLEVSGLVDEGSFIPSLVRYRDYYRPPMPPMPMASFDANPLICFTHDTVRFNNLSTPTEPLPQYEWVINPSTFSFIDGTNNQSIEPVVVFEQQGAYDISLIVTNEAGSDTLERLAYINVSSDVSIEGSDAFDGIVARVYPNPVLDVCNIDAGFFISMIEIYDLDGKLCMRQEYQLPKDQIVLDFSVFKDGIYLLRLYQAGQNTAVTLKLKKG
ncbi:MAG: T9SS type A sorting domain-containing protein, partial [Bacteroidales bacterium]|nr:T9SS type A sorting domain-containing protein [Bacteroidales bacterium]